MDSVKTGQIFLNSGVASNTPLQIISPTANVAGAIIRTATIQVYGNGGCYLCVGKTAPIGGANNMAIPFSYIASQYSCAVTPRSIEVPAGDGLWFYANAVGGGGVNITYDLFSA